MEIFSELLALCAVSGEFPTQKTVMRSFDVFFDLRLNKRVVGDLRRHRAHYDVIVMTIISLVSLNCRLSYDVAE